MRDLLTHRYFETQRDIVEDVVTTDLEQLRLAVAILRARIEADDETQTSLDLEADS